MLEDPEIDAVYNPLPNGLHAEWTIKALQKKKHVLCEKPLGASEAEVNAMFAASRENGVLLMEAFAYRHSPLPMKVKSLIDAGTIGDIKLIDSHFSFLLTDQSDVRLSPALAGGATYDLGCYNLSLIRYIAGEEPSEIYATGKVGETSGVDEESLIMMKFPSGKTAVSFCSFQASHRCEYVIVGTEGSIYAPNNFNQAGKTKIIVNGKDGAKEVTVDCPHNYMLEVEQFGRAILGQEKPFVTFEDSIGNARVIDETLRQVFGK
jgi:predicted dehydrogenase